MIYSEQKKHSLTPGAVVAFFMTLAQDTKLQTYLLTYLPTYAITQIHFLLNAAIETIMMSPAARGRKSLHTPGRPL